MKQFIFSVLFISVSFFPANGIERQQGRVFWKGMVDARVQLSIKGSELTERTLEATPYPDGIYSFTASLPSSPVNVGVKKAEGRGTATVVQQPTEENDYTAIVEIVDPKGGAKEYQLEIFWE